MNDRISLGSVQINIRERKVHVEGEASNCPSRNMISSSRSPPAADGSSVVIFCMIVSAPTNAEINPNLLEVLIYNLRKSAARN